MHEINSNKNAVSKKYKKKQRESPRRAFILRRIRAVTWLNDNCRRGIKLAVNNWCILRLNYVDWLQKITTALTVANCNLALVAARCSRFAVIADCTRLCFTNTNCFLNKSFQLQISWICFRKGLCSWLGFCMNRP